MKIKSLLIIIFSGILTISGFYYFHHNYVDTLMLSEIVGHSDNPGVNILVSMTDFDTGLTRHDINHLIKNKDYWFNRIQAVDSIGDSDIKEQESLKLLSDMMEDPVLNKICKSLLILGSDISLGIIEKIL